MKRTLTPTSPLCVLLLLAAMLAPAAAFGQQNSDGSVYSRFGLGELYQNGSAQIQAMGGGGTAVSTFNYINLSNPGSWADQAVTRLSGGVQFQGLDIANAAGDNSRLNSSMVHAFQFSFPMIAGKLGVVAGFTPYSRVAHRVQLTDTPITDDPTLTNPTVYNIRFEGSGGIQAITLGLGYRLNRFLGVGGGVAYNFGILQESRFTEFNTNAFGQTRLNLATRLSGFSASLGGLVTMPQLFTDNDALSLGVSVSTPMTFDGTQTLTTGTSLDQDTLGVPLRGELDIPLRANAGLAYYLNRRWIVVVDGTIEPWDRLDGDLALAGYAPGAGSLLDRRTRVSGGVEFLPSINPLDPYFSRTSFRLGAYSDTGYIVPQAGVSFRTTAVTGGLGLPTLFPGTYIDIGFEIGRRGSTDQGFVRESFYKLIFNMNIGERWFDRRKLG